MFVIWLYPIYCLAAESILKGTAGSLIKGEVISSFSEPWSMSFINDKMMLVAEKGGKLWLVYSSGQKLLVSGVPEVSVGGQGGLGDVIVHPNFRQNRLIYFSYVESDLYSPNFKGAVVARAKIEIAESQRLINIERIWSQSPKVKGAGHFSHKITFGPIGSQQEGKLFITSGDRQARLPAQDFGSALGKIIRLNEDGSVPVDNPFQGEGELARSFWTLGHRNALGISFDEGGRLWSHEMGPRHGDELNLIRPGKNYGWPIVSEGNHYDGRVIPNHNTRVDFEAPITFWVPTIAPSGLIFYSGDVFKEWNGNAFVGGLKSRALIRIEIEGSIATEVERFEWGSRVREVELGPNGSIWVLEDAPSGRLIKFTRPR
jgi:glucose/arabinose dehydrogenase